MTERIVIVGAGECGTRAAFALREQGFSGEIALISEEHQLPYERPPLSKQALLEPKLEPYYIASAQQFDAARIQLHLASKVTAIQRELQVITLETNGKSQALAYSKLLLATGASPRKLPTLMGIDCYYLRTFEDAQRIRLGLKAGKHIVMIGGGLIGLELAASARQLGAAVTVVEADSRILRRAIPANIAAALAKRHEQAGVHLIYNGTIQRAYQDKNKINLVVKTGVELRADSVIVAIGTTPNVNLAQTAGLAVDNGIVVNEYLQTADPHIYAAGDCCNFLHATQGRLRLETWRSAQQQGNLAANNLLGVQQPYSAVPWFWSDQYELGLQVAGLTKPEHQRVVRYLSDNSLIEFELDSTGHLVMAAGLGVATAVAKAIRIAELLIAKKAKVAPQLLADPNLNLKKLLK
ncbi:NAD(P)/FAD-dependent oxidoreductase [Thiolinea disciformis]|uniref:NAD(P)/FAD-dependent oxidoreductase n=1 Tax=Thiolinea disciformis TaxID=125614 RepID=UPI0003725315|nr:FAD-dependent oxidoreductase [Thiolinea disciformis]